MSFKVAKEKKGITLISLVVTIVVLLILASVTISMLFGDNGIITMAQKARDELEKASKNEEKELASVFGKNFSDYNGALSIKNGNLVNQFGEQIRLNGLVGTNYSLNHTKKENFNYYINSESIKALKSWGVNVLRIGLYPDEVEDSEKMEDYLNTIDLCIENNVYVVVMVWNNQDINENVDNVKKYFSILSKRYSNSPNILYEIANEPGIEWNYIKDYCNAVIPVIRQNSKESIIIIPNSSGCTEPNTVVLNDLNYTDNIMTSYHMYVGNMLTQDNVENLKLAIESGVPVFVTEWGTTLSDGNNGFYLEFSNAFMKIMDDYNLSWCNFELVDCNWEVINGTDSSKYPEYCGIVKHNEWNNSLSDDILTESGKYIKSILMHTNESYNNSDYAIMMERDNNYAFWQEDYINKITEIEFKKENEIPNDAILSWDISFLKDNSVIAYIMQKNDICKLYIVSKNTINLPIASGGFMNEKGMFQDFTNLKSIIFDNVQTTNVNDISQCFSNCSSLEAVKGIENWNTINVKWTQGMFTNCLNLESLDLTNWNTKNLGNTISMFSNCQKLKKIGNVKNWNTENLEYCGDMFSQTYSIEEIDLSNWGTPKLMTIDYMFSNCGAKIIRMDNFDLSKISNIRNIFYGTSNLESLYLNNLKIDSSSITNYLYSFTNMKNNVNIYVSNIKTAEFVNDRLKEGNAIANLYYKDNDDWILYVE